MTMTKSVICFFLVKNTIDVVKTGPFLPSGKDKYEMAKVIQRLVYQLYILATGWLPPVLNNLDLTRSNAVP